MSPARTETEVYRGFHGELRAPLLRCLPLAAAGLRVAVKKKLPLVLLYAPSAISTIVFSFIVYGKFALEARLDQGDVSPALAIGAALAGRISEVRELLIQAVMNTQIFALFAITWYGAGQIAEDRRAGANLLYFARPITRLDYALGKLLTVMAFGACAMLVPVLVICGMAAFSSPEWAFLKQEGDTVWKAALFASFWVGSLSLGVLALSSLVKRKGLAVAGAFAFYMANQALGGILVELFDDPGFSRFSILENFLRVGQWMFEIEQNSRRTWPVADSFWILGGVDAVFVAILAWRVRKLEVVA